MIFDGSDNNFIKLTAFMERQSFFVRVWTALKLIFGVYPVAEVILDPNQVKQLKEGLQNWEWENLSINYDEFD